MSALRCRRVVGAEHDRDGGTEERGALADLSDAQRDIEKTTVYYTTEADEDVARGLVVAMGVGQIRLVAPDVFPGTLINIVIGADYPGAVPAP